MLPGWPEKRAKVKGDLRGQSGPTGWVGSEKSSLSLFTEVKDGISVV